MKRAKVVAAVLCLLLPSLPSVALGWDGKNDNKSVEVLGMMDGYELCEEARSVCNHIASREAQMLDVYGAVEGVEYCKTIGRVARVHEKDSAWADTCVLAIGNKDKTLCFSMCKDELIKHDQGLKEKDKTEQSPPEKN